MVVWVAALCQCLSPAGRQHPARGWGSPFDDVPARSFIAAIIVVARERCALLGLLIGGVSRSLKLMFVLP